ncbi:MAG: NDMA-dependent alcohol dehydrogenase [Streptosporangiales bacterium]|nr:NDMA-dependent alcohol dehydrogenase [Streptosporangiales bacterium]
MGGFKTRAAILRERGRPWEIAELDLDPPKAGEVHIRFMASGLCHSDEHVRTMGHGGKPFVGGHEGAGVVEAVGPGVTRVEQGDHVVCSYVPVCGKCRYCSTGYQNLCDEGKNIAFGCMPDGTYRYHENGRDLGGFCMLGTFSQYAIVSEWSCVRIDDDIPFEVAALVGCGVPTGWASSVYAAGVRPGDTVVVYGVGGVGSNAVQGARYAGAKNLVAVDPVPFKLEMAQEFGATHVASDPGEAHDLVVELTRGQLADHAILTVGELDAETVRHAVGIVGKTGQVTVTAVGRPGENQLELPAGGPTGIIGYQRRIQGALFGNANPLYDIPKLLGLYRAGDLKLDELITQRYRLDQVNDGYRDLLGGKNIRGVIIHEH